MEPLDYYFSANKSSIVAKIDVRGVGYSGDEMQHALYKKLGTAYQNEFKCKVLGQMVDHRILKDLT